MPSRDKSFFTISAEVLLNLKSKLRRQLPFHVLVVFLLIVLGIGLHLLTTYLCTPELQTLRTTGKPFHIKKAETAWENTHLLNLSAFQYLRNNVSLCSSGLSQDDSLEENILLILVTSGRENYNERTTIRKAMQKMNAVITSNTDWTLRLVFLLGQPFDPDNSGEREALLMEDAFLDEEQAVYGDLIMGSFIDSYDNLTYKSMMGLKWALTYCSNATFIVKMNDNAFFNVPRFVEMRNDELIGVSSVADKKPADLYCISVENDQPLRTPIRENRNSVRYLVTESEWPASTFPNYCQGIWYGMTMSLAKEIYEVSRESRYIRLEDVFVTGVALEKVEERFGNVVKRNVSIGQESEQTLKTICDTKVMRQTVSREIGLVVRLARGAFMEKQMLCLAKEVQQ